MAKEESLKKLVEEEIVSAKNRLKAAKALLEKDLLPDGVNRIYYASFHAAKAGLYSIGKDPPKTHSGLISEFGIWIIQASLIPKKYGRILRNAFEARQSSDYELATVFEADEVKKLFLEVKEFIEVLERFALEKVKDFDY